MKRGFTLIELLAVIVILAIIAVIAVPIIINIIDDTKKSSTLRSAEMYLKGLETSVATSTINGEKIEDGTYQITKDGDICLADFEDNTCSEENTLKVEMSGETPSSGTITIEKGKIKDIELNYENKTVGKNEQGSLIYVDPTGFHWDYTMGDPRDYGCVIQDYDHGQVYEMQEGGFYVGCKNAVAWKPAIVYFPQVEIEDYNITIVFSPVNWGGRADEADVYFRNTEAFFVINKNYYAVHINGESIAIWGKVPTTLENYTVVITKTGSLQNIFLSDYHLFKDMSVSDTALERGLVKYTPSVDGATGGILLKSIHIEKIGG